MTPTAGNVIQLSKLCKPPRCALFVLGQHIQDAALRYLSLTQSTSVVLSAYGVFDLSERYEGRVLALRQSMGKEGVRPPRHVVIQGSLR